ncbi:amidohydrolase family protein, partial [Streptomyces althioticus]|uniref:amidohydrolase family protein n=1 Tax=Streptomyces althioticus TaxID=83380 RepID=UPI0034123281
MNTPTVDVHAHVLLPEVEALVAGLPGHAEAKELDARRNGPAALAVSGPMVRERIPRLTDPAVRLAAMDAQGVDVQLVCPSPSHYHYWADKDTAEKLYRLANEATAAHCAAAPDRLRGLGLAPLQHPEQAVRALDHTLEQGLAGVEISSHAPGRELSAGAAPRRPPPARNAGRPSGRRCGGPPAGARGAGGPARRPAAR